MKTRKLVYGMGVNDADYAVEKRETTGYVDGKRKQKTVWSCAYYDRWADMLNRCYSIKTQNKHPTYRGCSVSGEWLTFSNFRSWMVAQDWEGKHLDKDLLFEGNKIYSPETCVFVSPMVNTFINDNGAARGKWLIGVSLHKRNGKFIAQCSNPFTKKLDYLGYFTTEEEAHQAWQDRKLELAHLLAAEQTDHRVAEALINRYSK